MTLIKGHTAAGIQAFRAGTGIRVLEIGPYTAGPLAGRYLSDLGAEVIKIESPGGEVSRQWTPQFDGWSGDLSACASTRGAVHERVNQLRDPAIYVEDDRVYLLYAVAGESGLALAEVLLLPATRNPVAFEPGLIKTPRIGTARHGETELC